MSEVEEEIELAEEALKDLEVMQDASLRRRYTTLYFSVYHAARAALISMQYAPKTHSGLDSLVHNILANKEGLIEEEEAQYFSKLKTRREQADYETGFFGDEEEFAELKDAAEELVEKLRGIAED
ncbi:MAG: HEPN domain-containing protein [Candidatus Nanohaloarchaea archaeon]